MADTYYRRIYSRRGPHYICVLDIVAPPTHITSSKVITPNVQSDIWHRHPHVWPSSHKLVSWEEFKDIHQITIEEVLEAYKSQ